MSKKTKFIHVDDDGYTVGYCKPPKATQFRKGVSPNPKGRKRNIEFFKWEDPVFEVLFEDLTLPMKGKPVTLPSIVWMLRSMRNNAVKGCHRSFKFLIDANGDRGLKGLWYALKDKCRERTEAEIEQVRRWLNEDIRMAEDLERLRQESSEAPPPDDGPKR